MRVTTVLLDVNETLFSLTAVGDALSSLGLDRPDDLDLWFARVLRDGFAVTAMAELVAFPALAAHHLAALAHERGVALPPDAGERLVRSFDRVTPQPDTAVGLTTLAASGRRLVPFTNGSAPVVARFLDRHDLTGVVDPPRDVSGAGVWKPAAAAYAWACEQVGCAPAETALLAVHPWDVAGAMGAGLTGVWLDRTGDTPWPGFLRPPDHTVATIGSAAAVLR